MLKDLAQILFPWGRSLGGGLLISLLFFNTACQSPIQAPAPPALMAPTTSVTSGSLSEVAPPTALQELAPIFDQYQPQVSILRPTPEQVLSDTTVAVDINVRDLPLFQAPNLEMGPHLHVIVDNEPYRAVYNVDQPILLEDLTPGTHTLRVFPVRPWHESFKNDGAFAQVTFHVLTKTNDNAPVPEQPLLTYSRPKGHYGAEPILLDFYLTQAPLPLLDAGAGNTSVDNDWRIRVTINGESFLLDRWQSPYLKGFKPGKNWVKLEFIDAQGNLVTNGFNSTVRVIDYQPKGQDALSRLVRGELTSAERQAISQPQPRLSQPDEDASVPSLISPVPAPDVRALPLEELTPETDIPLPVVTEATPDDSSPEMLAPDPRIEESAEEMVLTETPEALPSQGPMPLPEVVEASQDVPGPASESTTPSDTNPEETETNSVLSGTKMPRN